MNTKTITRNFTYHAPHGDQPARFELLRSTARGLAVTIQANARKAARNRLLLRSSKSASCANAAIARNEIEGGEQ